MQKPTITMIKKFVFSFSFSFAFLVIVMTNDCLDSNLDKLTFVTDLVCLVF